MTRLPCLVFLSVLAANSQALAQKVCVEADPDLCSMAVTAGDKAEFSGQLLTPGLALKLGQKAEQCDARMKAEVDFAKALAKVDLDLEKKLRANETEALRQELALVKERMKVPWYERPWFVVTVTIVLTVGLVGVSAWGMGQLK